MNSTQAGDLADLFIDMGMCGDYRDAESLIHMFSREDVISSRGAQAAVLHIRTRKEISEWEFLPMDQLNSEQLAKRKALIKRLNSEKKIGRLQIDAFSGCGSTWNGWNECDQD